MSRNSPSVALPPARGEPNEGAPGSKPERLEPGLYLVATPIGNLRDMSLRAIDLLSKVNIIACEDTRITRKLLDAHAIARPLTAYHDYNADRRRPQLIKRIECGEAVALVSDAGTPLVSDPGFKLVRAAIDAGLRVEALPGPSAALTALLVSGLPSDRFFFAGFLPSKPAARRRALVELAGIDATLVFFESARRLARALEDMSDLLGARPAAVARELTKRFEEVRRGTLSDLATLYAGAPAPRGEIAVVVGPPVAPAPVDAEDLDARLRAALAHASLRDAAAAVATASGLPKRRVYARALELAGEAKGVEAKGGEPAPGVEPEESGSGHEP